MLTIVKRKGCKRCGGDLFLELDTSKEVYVTCLQCSATYYQPEPVQVKKPVMVKVR